MLENIKKILEEYKEDTKRHFDVVAEDLGDKIKQVAEGVSLNTEKLRKHDKRFDKIEDDLEIVKTDIGIIKVDIEFIKNELKQKVGRDEFAVLEKRVSMLEAKLNQRQ